MPDALRQRGDEKEGEDLEVRCQPAHIEGMEHALSYRKDVVSSKMGVNVSPLACSLVTPDANWR